MTAWTAALVTAAWVGTLGWRPASSLKRLHWPDATGRSTPPDQSGRGRVLALSLGCATVLTVIFRPDARVVLATVATAVVTWVVRRVVDLGRERRARRVRQRRVVVLCDALAAELRGGLPLTSVIQRCCRDDAELAPVIHAAELGGDIAGALRSSARLPGMEGLRAVAAAWDVAGHAGSALSAVLDRMAVGLRNDEEARAEVEAALGPPRATAKLLAVLPIFGLALGTSIDAHPVRFLLGTSTGLVCLCTGAALALLGVWWVERLAASAEV